LGALCVRGGVLHHADTVSGGCDTNAIDRGPLSPVTCARSPDFDTPAGRRAPGESPWWQAN
jgi:hypothetical protein